MRLSLIMWILFEIFGLRSVKAQEFNSASIFILPLSAVNAHLYWEYPRGTHFKHAFLAHGDVSRIDRIITVYIRKYNLKIRSDSDSDTIDLRKCLRQYIVFFNSLGQKEVFVNFFPRSMERDAARWKRALVEVDDGGKDFFRLIIDLDTGKVHGFSTNGFG
jgi:hypothetical protein